MLETTIAGSLPKPGWLAEPQMLWAPWQLEGEQLLEAKRDATLLALKEQEDAGIDIVTDGEQARQHFVHPNSGSWSRIAWPYGVSVRLLRARSGRL
jgi:5-methyltetrahydropteroyltriglutamate--homocysteine methyltransferase